MKTGKEMRSGWEMGDGSLLAGFLGLLLVAAAQQLFNIPVIRIVIFVVPLRVFDFNTNFTFYNQINWSRCRRITSWTGLSPARDAVETHRRKGVARGRHRVSSPRGCLSLAAFDAPSLGRTWDPRSVANLCKYWHRHSDKERNRDRDSDRDRDSAPVRQLN